MVRPGRDHLAGEIEADETYVGGPEEGKRGRQVESKAIVAVAAEQRGRGIGRIRLRRVNVPPRACWPSCKTPWSRGRQFIPTAGEATPGCRPPVIAIRSR